MNCFQDFYTYTFVFHSTWSMNNEAQQVQNKSTNNLDSLSFHKLFQPMRWKMWIFDETFPKENTMQLIHIASQ